MPRDTGRDASIAREGRPSTAVRATQRAHGARTSTVDATRGGYAATRTAACASAGSKGRTITRPLLRVTHTKGAFSEDQRDALAERFTHAILVGAIGSDNDIARGAAYVQFVELDGARGGWYVGGKRESNPPRVDA